MKEHSKQFDSTEWYELWMQQSKVFFESAEENLKNVFNQKGGKESADHLKQFEAWIDSLKKQWQFVELSDEQKKYQEYWGNMSKMCMEASDLMSKEWIKRSKENHPVKDIRELYEIWLKCCSEVYQKSLLTHHFQKNYGEFVNAAFDFWKNAGQ